MPPYRTSRQSVALVTWSTYNLLIAVALLAHIAAVVLTGLSLGAYIASLQPTDPEFIAVALGFAAGAFALVWALVLFFIESRIKNKQVRMSLVALTGVVVLIAAVAYGWYTVPDALAVANAGTDLKGYRGAAIAIFSILIPVYFLLARKQL
jgi:hypothetical protein